LQKEDYISVLFFIEEILLVEKHTHTPLKCYILNIKKTKNKKPVSTWIVNADSEILIKIFSTITARTKLFQGQSNHNDIHDVNKTPHHFMK
jgi:hypothetical protein